ncbi:MAG: putative bifunctional diguanylate cyclase/phosphodiesterase, partial [Actinomycetota bacterium]
KEHQKRLEYLAHYDPLTRLPNRVLLADRIQRALHQAQRTGEVVAVAYLDLDGFKPINDTLGHASGDLLLIEVAKRLRTCVRMSDTVARLGGDEFVLIIKAQDFGDCEAATLRVLSTLSAPYAIDGMQVELSASIGVTLYPSDGADPDVLLRHADQAMYIAKQAGRNRYHLFDSEHDRRLSEHRERLTRIESALASGELALFYQPKVDMREGKVIGAEALIRWHHPEDGLVPPAEFLPLVEDTEFSITLGDWVIATAMAQMQAWRKAGLELPVSVNISARQLQSETFVHRLEALLAAHPDVPPEWLELEILETAALDDIPYVGQVIKRCQALGLSFALDDFGTGYSSLAYFKRLPARLLKIDQSFIRDMLVDPEDLAIVDGVISLARAFRREVIAEGVETVEHGIRLLEMGCHLAQGYGIARPMPADAVPDWIRSYRPDPRWLACQAG